MLALLALAGIPALAFQPNDAVHIGLEPTRIRRVHTERQHALRHGSAWQAFAGSIGQGWQVVFDERTGTPHRAWGPGIAVGAITDGEQAAAAVQRLLSDHAALVGVPPRSLRLGHAAYDVDKDRWFLRLDQTVPGSNRVVGNAEGALEHFASHGAPVVWRGAVEAWIQHGRLTMLSVDTYPEATRIGTTPTLDADAAIEAAIALGPEPGLAHDIDGAVLVVLPQEVPGGLEHRLAWMVRSRTGDLDAGILPGHWVSFIDAHTGALLNVHNQVRYLSGNVQARHDTRTVDGDTSISPLVDLFVDGDDGSQGRTDLDGDISLDGASTFSAALDGEYFRIFNDAGDEGSVRWNDGDVIWGEEDASIAEIDSYVFLNQVRAWADLYAYDVSLTTFKISSTVNISDSCNAYYDGNVNFFQKGGGCNNTGRIADVNYHEWGHGLHYSAAGSYYLDGSVGEGAGDTLAVLNTGDPVMAPYFMESGSGIREVATNRRYPDDVVGEVHADGLIYGGAMWDTWAELEASIGPEEAYDTVSRLFVEGLQFNPELAETYDAMVAADDDNGDLSDGTPHQCQILDGFAPHGLGPGGAASILELSHPLLGNQQEEGAGYAVTADLVNLAPDCVEPGVGTAEVVYSTNGGETWERAALDATEDTVSGVIPAVQSGSVVTYYLELESADGNRVMAPQGGEINPTTFAVGELTELYFEDFEDDDGGYRHELVSGEQTDGADDWQWGTPVGLAGDPDFAFSGSKVWGNDLGGEWDGNQYNGEYQNDKVNRLTSPAIDVPEDERVVIQFRRWLNVEDGYYDQAKVTVDGEVLWTNHETSQSNGSEHHEDAQWALETIEVPAELREDGVIEISWSIHSDGGLTMGGWTLDDVGVYTIRAADSEVPAPGETGEGDPVDGEKGAITACGCASTSSAPSGLALLGLVGLATARRRRD